MITGITVQNLRVFRDREWRFPLRAMTVLCGTNSAGKSTVLKSVLLLRQALGIREAIPPSAGVVRLSGSQVDFGSYRTLVSDGDRTKDVSIGLTITGDISARRASVLPGYAGPADPSDDVSIPYEMDCMFTVCPAWRLRRAPESGTPLLPDEARPELEQEGGGKVRLAHAAFRVRQADRVLIEWNVEPSRTMRVENDSEIVYDLVMPEEYIAKIGGHRFRRAVTDGGLTRFPVLLRGLLADRVVVQEEIELPAPSEQNNELSWTVYPIPPQVGTFQARLRKVLTDVSTVGPLRAPARRYYVADTDAPLTSDLRGEAMHYELRDRAHEPITYLPPSAESTKAVTRPLRDALDEWLFYLRTGDTRIHEGQRGELCVSTTYNVLVEMTLRSSLSAVNHPLTDSGFGYSQILPILVRVLLAPPDTLVIIEQPELHLNPALQVRLAAFFVAAAVSGRQIIVESHSEHIVNGLRVLAAEDREGNLASKLGIIYLAEADGHLVLHDLSILPNGTVPKWPREFFGEAMSLAGRLLRAQRLARSKASEETP